MIRTLLILACAGALSACATPTVVNPTQVTDVQLNCVELYNAIEDAERFEQEAREDRGVTSMNVAAAVFFWPALVGTYYNTEEAIEAAESRQSFLRSLYEDRQCNV